MKINLLGLKDLRVIKGMVGQLDLRVSQGLQDIQGVVALLGVRVLLVEVEQQALLVL